MKEKWTLSSANPWSIAWATQVPIFSARDRSEEQIWYPNPSIEHKLLQSKVKAGVPVSTKCSASVGVVGQACRRRKCAVVVCICRAYADIQTGMFSLLPASSVLAWSGKVAKMQGKYAIHVATPIPLHALEATSCIVCVCVCVCVCV